VNRFGNPVRPGLEYWEKVVALGPIAYWPLWETAGATAHCLINPLQDGTYTGATLNNAVGPDGVNGAPFFDGANDYVDIGVAAFIAAFSGPVGSLMCWGRVANAAVWTDGLLRYKVYLYCDANNRYFTRKQDVNNQIRGLGAAGAGQASIDVAYTSADWFVTVDTWSDGNNADEFKYYLNGAQQGATSAALNNWAGALNGNLTQIGAATQVPTAVWHGWLAHCAVWDRVLTPAEVLELATI